MKFKLKQPTKYMHEGLQNEDLNSQESNQNQNIKKQEANSQNNLRNSAYKKKKIIKKKNQPSAARLNKINQTFQNIYKNSQKLFSQLEIDTIKLQQFSQLKTRQKCLCNKNTKFYCLKCFQKVCSQPFPSVQLPFEVSIIHHESQKINKSSAIPLQFLTNQVKIHSFSSLQEGRNEKLWLQLPKPDKNVFILFPHKQSKLVYELFQKQEDKQRNVIKHLIILDCTWFQTDQLIQILKGKGYNQYVRIQGYKSIFWRYNHHNDQALSSAQALTFFLREYQKSYQKINQTNPQTQLSRTEQLQNNEKYIKKYDNLLFLYCLNLKMILKDEEKRIQSNVKEQSNQIKNK